MKMKTQNQLSGEQEKGRGLYRPEFEHDNCGIGAVVQMKGIKSHDTVDQALHIVEHLEHRAGKTRRERPGTASAFSFRFPINFSPKYVKRQVSAWAERGNTASACFSSHRGS